jgi:hypothetical protein
MDELGTGVPWHPLAPNSPWVKSEARPTGRLIYHYSADFARLPCRDVTKLADTISPDGVRRADNKSDPNLETLTFGMWSTCDQQYRQTIGDQAGRYLFFRTNWPTPNHPVLTGFYYVGWYLDSWYVAPPGRSRGARVVTDRFLAAQEAHFVAKPIPIADAADLIGYDSADLRRRSVIEFEPNDAAALRNLLLEQPDHTKAFLDEIRRLEYCNLASTGRRYVNWDRTQGFSWLLAKPCVDLAARPRPSNVVQAAWGHGVKNGVWACDGCQRTIASPRPIKLCSQCSDGGCFLPVAEPVTV